MNKDIEVEKILLVRTAWMNYYEGRPNIDPPRSGAKYILENKRGGEINNFKNRNGHFYGYIPVFTVNIDNLGANSDEEFIKGITVVFCATHPVEKGMRIVGWYKNATVYRKLQKNKFGNWYSVDTNKSNVVRIDAENRLCNIPDTFGRTATFFFSLHPEKNEIFQKVKNYILSDGKIEIPTKENKKSVSKLPRQADVETRIKVEKSAINVAVKFYADRHGRENVKSVEKDNVGWDLEIKTNTVTLKVEVKGLSGSKMAVELTPNEYKALNKRQENYYLFIVTNALEKNPKFEIFSCLKKSNIMIGNKQTELIIKKVVGARIG